MVALAPDTGETIWASGDEPVSYCSALPIEFENQDVVVGYFKNSVGLFDFESGAPLGSFRVSEDYDEHSAWPVYREPYLWLSGPFRKGCRLLELSRVDNKIALRNIYKSDVMSNDVASCVLVGDSLYGFDIRDVQSKVHRPSRGQFSCIDFLTGDIRWQNGTLKRRSVNRNDGEMISSAVGNEISDVGHASVIVADDKLLMLNDTGTLIVAEVDAAEYRELGRWVILGGEIVWTGPTLLNKCIYARNQSRAVCVYVGEPTGLGDVLNGADESLQYASEIEQPRFTNLAAIVLGTEPEYAMTSPKLSWLVSWFVVSLVFGWVAAPLIAMVIASIKLPFWLSTRSAFLCTVLVFGVLGTTIAGRWLGIVFFSWPMVLAIVFEWLVCQIKGTQTAVKDRPVVARLGLLGFIGVCFAYFWLCRKLSLAFHWSFLIGFPAALPLLFVVKNSVQAGQAFCLRQWICSAAGFTAFYWCGAGVILWVYGT